MGHVLTGPLPRTRKWVRVVELIHAGAGAAQVATATTAAAERWFKKAADVEAVRDLRQGLLRPPHVPGAELLPEQDAPRSGRGREAVPHPGPTGRVHPGAGHAQPGGGEDPGGVLR